MIPINYKTMDNISDLLAILHGDGGHYENKHGRDMAIQHAIDLIHIKWVFNKHLADINLAANEIQKLKNLNVQLKNYISGINLWIIKYDHPNFDFEALEGILKVIAFHEQSTVKPKQTEEQI